MKVERRTARKWYECVICGKAIKPGDRYEHVTALPGVDLWDLIVDNKPTTWRECGDRECWSRTRPHHDDDPMADWLADET